MTRLLGVLLALASLGLGVTATASSASASSSACANPVKLTGYHGTRSYPPYTVQQDVWTEQGQQTMSVCNQSYWTATVNETGAPATGVKTYPDSSKAYTDWQHCSSQPAVGSFTKLNSNYSENGPAAGSWDYAYDIFLNGSLCNKPVTEVMIWNQWRAVSVPTAQLHASIAGVPYDIYHSGGYIQVRRVHQNTSGTVNVLAILHYLQAHNLVHASDTMQFVQYGVEVLTTSGRNLNFHVGGFGISDARK